MASYYHKDKVRVHVYVCMCMCVCACASVRVFLDRCINVKFDDNYDNIVIKKYCFEFQVKFLFDEIKNDWIEFKNTEQFSIVQYYAEESRIYTLILIGNDDD